jgi:hypothetical protein
MHAKLLENDSYILKVINGWRDPFYDDKKLDDWKNIQPYCLEQIPQIWVFTITGQRDVAGNQVGQKWTK